MKTLAAIGTALSILLSLLIVQTSAETYVSGIQSGTWTLAGSPYIVTGNVSVSNGQTLAIDPGVSVKFNGNY